MGPTRAEDKAADILALARSLVHENDATLGRSKSTLRKTMRKAPARRARAPPPSCATRWKSRTMQQLANGRTLCGNQNDGRCVNQGVACHADAKPLEAW